MAAKVTTGNVLDTQSVAELAYGLPDKLYGDKGYLSKGVTLVTTVSKNMKAWTISLCYRILLSKRFIIESINDQLKNISFIEHSRHLSMKGCILNLMAGLVVMR